MPLRRLAITLIIMVCLSASALVSADVVELKPDHPERYTVQKGDTLWDIATRFLKSPWHWARIWKGNQQIKNPHLIYPGDVIVLRWVDGQPELTVLRDEKLAPPVAPEAAGEEPEPAAAPGMPAPERDERPTKPGVTRLKPRIYSEPIGAAIPTIPPNAILPFLTHPHVVGRGELDRAGYVTVGLDDRIALGDHSQFYARGLKDKEQEYYYLFREGKALRHPDTNELLAYEALYLGDAQMLEPGDPSKLVVTAVKQEIVPRDRLLAAAPKASLPYYYPHAPSRMVRGYVLSAVNAVAEMGSFTVITISLGNREGMEEGHVLRIMRHVGRREDPVTKRNYKMPDEQSGLAMIFKVFDKVSYALIMSSTRPVHINDTVITP